MEIIKTSKGKDMLLNHGYSYVKKKVCNGWIRWQCTSQRSKGCKGGLTTDEHPIINPRSLKPHNHELSDCKMEVQKFLSELNVSAQTNSAVRTMPLLTNGLLNLSAEALIESGNIESIKRDIQRQKSKSRPLEPGNRAEINLVTPWTTTGGVNPLPFLFHDSGPQDPQRMLLFGTDEGLAHLDGSSVWYMDGNFKVSPVIFLQLYVIRAKLDDGAISCVYAFLSGKVAHNYNSLFAAIIGRCHTLGIFPTPTNVITDFEMAVFISIRNVFGPGVETNGCFYHLTQSTWRRVQNLGLQQLYLNDDEVKKFAGMMDGLAFLPVNDLLNGVAILQLNIPDQALLLLLEYFLDTYVLGPIIANTNPAVVHRAPPLFPPNTWNVFDVTLAGGSRTNKFAKGGIMRF